MNERLAAALFAGISVALIGAETTLAAIYGFDPGLILFCLALYAGAAGLLFSVKLLLDGGGDRIESVSERRARAKRGDGGILEGYDVDEEFLGSGMRASKPVPAGGRPIDDESLKAAISSYAGMAGGLGKLRETIESMDDASFGAMVRKIGASGVPKERALAAIAELASAESGGSGRDEVPPLTISLDRETFDDYIRRCMTDGDTCIDDDEGSGEGFSVGLDAEGLSRLPGEPPAEFSHKPEAVKAKINRPGGDRS